MKLGFGLYRHQITPDNLRFARQCGATHLVVHLVDYFRQPENDKEGDNPATNQPTGGSCGWGICGDPNDPIWSKDSLLKMKDMINEAGLEWYAIENFDPSMWYDVLLGGPQRDVQLQFLKQLITRVGEVGIPVFGYNFSIAGVADRKTGPFARGGALSVGMDGTIDQSPLPKGMVWNMVYDSALVKSGETIPSATHDELWARLAVFLNELLPTCEKVGVCLCAHPDDPPCAFVRSQPRLVYKRSLYKRLLDVNSSSYNCLEFCLGTLAEMEQEENGPTLYDAVDMYSQMGRLGYVHCRNIRGVAPHYKETFIDEPDTEMNLIKVLRILKKNGYDGVVIPDHAPCMVTPGCHALCGGGSGWYEGMAFAMGYISCAISVVMNEDQGQGREKRQKLVE